MQYIRARMFPARAGVVLATSSTPTVIRCASRTRGSGSYCQRVGEYTRKYFPHTRGWFSDKGHYRRRHMMLFRIRGGKPDGRMCNISGQGCFPHARGWLFPYFLGHQTALVFPAHAGVSLIKRKSLRAQKYDTRMHGGGSNTRTERYVFPAHAGVDPTYASDGCPTLMIPAHAGVALNGENAV